jgi:hypothetical protein
MVFMKKLEISSLKDFLYRFMKLKGEVWFYVRFLSRKDVFLYEYTVIRERTMLLSNVNKEIM